MPKGISNATVEIKGLRETRKFLTALEPAMKDAFKDAHKQVADHVITKIKPKFPQIMEFPTGKAARTLRSGRQQANAVIKFGSAATKYAPLLEMGGSIRGAFGRSGSVEYKPYQRKGRIFMPTIREENKNTRDIYGKILFAEMAKVRRKSGVKLV